MYYTELHLSFLERKQKNLALPLSYVSVRTNTDLEILIDFFLEEYLRTVWNDTKVVLTCSTSKECNANAKAADCFENAAAADLAIENPLTTFNRVNCKELYLELQKFLPIEIYGDIYSYVSFTFAYKETLDMDIPVTIAKDDAGSRKRKRKRNAL
jgi:hypothetical protein